MHAWLIGRAGGPHQLVCIDRLPATPVHLCHGVTHDVLACWLGVSRSTITGGRGGAPAAGRAPRHRPGGVRLPTLADMVAHLGASGRVGLLDVTEVWVRRPVAHRPVAIGSSRARLGPTR
jgi:hypothetical protein